jgi:hypothetical protein
MSAPDTARAYISRGWTVVPIPAGRKGPAEEGWQHLRISLDGVAQHFSAGCNIGGILGQAAGELVDVDLDCPEALALADQYLPPTQAIFGRRAKPKSHQLYIAPGAAFETFADPLGASKNMLLELRAAGRDGGAHQILLPPSVADRERREWHGEIIAPAVVNSTILRTACAWLAIGCLVRRHVGEYPSEHPGPDLPDLLAEADPKLGEAARRWLHLPEPGTARTVRLHPGRDMTADELDLAELVHAIPNNCGWEDWNKIGLAIYATTGGSDYGAVVFDDWSAKSPKCNPYTTTHRWRQFHRSPPSRTGIGKLVKLALQAGWRGEKAPRRA